MELCDNDAVTGNLHSQTRKPLQINNTMEQHGTAWNNSNVPHQSIISVGLAQHHFDASPSRTSPPVFVQKPKPQVVAHIREWLGCMSFSKPA